MFESHAYAFCAFLQSLGYCFLGLSSVFKDEIMHKQIQNLFLNITITFEQIYVFEASVTSSDRPSLATQSEVASPLLPQGLTPYCFIHPVNIIII